jgi:hypothetical protein
LSFGAVHLARLEPRAFSLFNRAPKGTRISLASAFPLILCFEPELFWSTSVNQTSEPDLVQSTPIDRPTSLCFRLTSPSGPPDPCPPDPCSLFRTCFLFRTPVFQIRDPDLLCAVGPLFLRIGPLLFFFGPPLFRTSSVLSSRASALALLDSLRVVFLVCSASHACKCILV